MTDSGPEKGGVTDPAVHAAAAKAIELISDGALVGLGSGRAVSVFIAKLGELQRDGEHGLARPQVLDKKKKPRRRKLRDATP